MTADIDALLASLREDYTRITAKDMARLLAAFDAMRERAEGADRKLWEAEEELKYFRETAERKLAEAERQRDAAVEALRPFGKLGDCGWGSALPSESVLAVWWADDDNSPHKTKRPHITQGDIRRARAIVQENSNG